MFTKITNKIFGLVLGNLLVLGIILTSFTIYFTYKNGEKDIEELDKTLRQDFDTNAKNEVETAISLLQAVYNKYQNGEYSLEDAKKAGADLVRVLSYGNEGYFWIDTKDGTNIVLLGRDTEGKNRYESLDSKGSPFIKTLISNGLKEGGGFTDYWFSKKGGGDPLPKRGYTLYFKPFEWIVGTGNYIDDIDRIISEKKVTNKK